MTKNDILNAIVDRLPDDKSEEELQNAAHFYNNILGDLDTLTIEKDFNTDEKIENFISLITAAYGEDKIFSSPEPAPAPQPEEPEIITGEKAKEPVETGDKEFVFVNEDNNEETPDENQEDAAPYPEPEIGDTRVMPPLDAEPVDKTKTEEVEKVAADEPAPVENPFNPETEGTREYKPVKTEAEEKPKKKTPEMKESKTTPLFVVLFILLLPVTAICCALGLVLLGLLYILVTALVVAFFAAMIAVMAAGLVITLVGLIYGITQIPSNLPIALFEIGIGIAAGGLTIVLTVLFYNISVKWLTKLYKPVGKLASLMKKALVGVFAKLKGACDR